MKRNQPFLLLGCAHHGNRTEARPAVGKKTRGRVTLHRGSASTNSSARATWGQSKGARSQGAQVQEMRLLEFMLRAVSETHHGPITLYRETSSPPDGPSLQPQALPVSIGSVPCDDYSDLHISVTISGVAQKVRLCFNERLLLGGCNSRVGLPTQHQWLVGWVFNTRNLSWRNVGD